MEAPADIVVFRKFNNSIDANIVKTKLDAYGIPCFLTEENLSNLYAGQLYMHIPVRLHMFAKDVEQARQIVDEQNLVLADDMATRCPRCRSLAIERDFPKGLTDKLLTGLNVIFFGIFFPAQKVYRCLDCDHEFKEAL